MNKNIDITEKIELRPHTKTYWAHPIKIRILELLSFFFSTYFFISAHYILFVFPFIVLLLLLWREVHTWLYLRSCQWSITEEEIYQKSGILSTTVEHVELYRIIDYKEYQSFVMRMLGLKSVALLSNDKLNKVIWLQGLPVSMPIIQTIRNRVEVCKTKKGLQQFTYV